MVRTTTWWQRLVSRSGTKPAAGTVDAARKWDRARLALERLEDRAVPAAGDLDPTFGSGGTVVTDFGGDDFPVSVAIQGDGKIVTAGTTYAPFGSIILARHLPDGSLDPTFGTGGTVTTTFDGGHVASAGPLAVQPDGRIVVCGSVQFLNPNGVYSASDIALARYNPDGSLDASFGDGGTTVTDLGGYDSANDLTLQPDGRIVVAGSRTTSVGGSRSDVALIRYNPDGSLDASFGAGGTVITDFGSEIGTGGQEAAFSVVIQPDGRVVAAGYTSHYHLGEPSTDGILARYMPDGSPDGTFGAGGKVIADLGGLDYLFSVALQADGRIVAGGQEYALDYSGSDALLARFLPDGSLDTSFGSGGVVTTDFGAYDGVSRVTLAGGKIVAAGYTYSTTTDTTLARYLPDGNLDGSFGSGGTVVTDIGGYDAAASVAVQPDGRMVIAGDTTAPGTFIRDVFVARFVGDDTTPPTAAITAGPPAVTNSQAARFGFAGSDAQSGVDHLEYRLDGGGWTATTGTTADFTGLSEGNHTFAVRAVDRAGNVGDPVSFTWVVDRATGLSVAAASGTYGGTTTLQATLTWHGDGSPLGGKAIAFTIDGTPVGTAVTGGNGVAVLTNVSLAGIGAGEHVVGAAFAGDSGYAGSSGPGSLTVAKATPTVTAVGGSFIYDGIGHPATGSVAGVGGASLGTPTFTYSYTDDGGNVVTTAAAPVDPGYYTATASFAGNDNYLPASAVTTVLIAYEARSLTDLSRAFNAGRTIPIRVQLTDAAGSNVSSAGISVTAVRLERVNADGTRTPVPLQDAGGANPGNRFRYDAALGGYVFNLSTRGLGAGTYRFFWTAEGDLSERMLSFRLI